MRILLLQILVSRTFENCEFFWIIRFLVHRLRLVLSRMLIRRSTHDQHGTVDFRDGFDRPKLAW